MFVLYRWCHPYTHSHAPILIQKTRYDRLWLVLSAETLCGSCPSLHALTSNGSRLDKMFFASHFHHRVCWSLKLLHFFLLFSPQLSRHHSCGFPNFSSCSNRCGAPWLHRTTILSLRAKDCKRLKDTLCYVHSFDPLLPQSGWFCKRKCLSYMHFCPNQVDCCLDVCFVCLQQDETRAKKELRTCWPVSNGTEALLTFFNICEIWCFWDYSHHIFQSLWSITLFNQYD